MTMRGPQQTNGIYFTTDTEIHWPASEDNNLCPPCKSGSGYPKAHEGCKKGGFLHASERFDLDVGGETKYLITRCDKCGKEGLVQ